MQVDGGGDLKMYDIYRLILGGICVDYLQTDKHQMCW